MKLFYALKRFLISLINGLWNTGIFIHELKNIFAKRKLWRKVVLTNDQRREIDEYWKANYGRKIPYWWHRLYMSYGGGFDVRYFPEFIFTTKFERRACSMFTGEVLSNKNLLDCLNLSSEETPVYTPETLGKVMNGICYVEGRPVMRDEMLAHIYAHGGQVVGKIARGSASGRGVKFFDLDEMRLEDFRKAIIDWHQPDLIFQVCLRPHPALAKLNATSINTVRVNTYVNAQRGEICLMPTHMRIGRKGSRVDNAHAGGMIIGVDEEGWLTKRALGEWGQLFDRHPDSGQVFEGYQVPMVPQMLEAAKRLHSTFVNMEFISWDFTVDDQDRLILIEVNLNAQTVWAPQIANGKTLFGEDTGYILSRLRKGWRSEL